MGGRGGSSPGSNGGNSAEVNPSFCSLWIKGTFERQRAFLFKGGPPKAAGHACSELRCLGAWGVQEFGHGQGTELLAPGREICCCKNVGSRTAYHLSEREKEARERKMGQ